MVDRAAVGGIPGHRDDRPVRHIRPQPTNKRIEIKAVRLKDGSEGLYWRWRWQDAAGKRYSSYGGRIDTLSNRARLQQYRRNRRRHMKREAGG